MNNGDEDSKTRVQAVEEIGVDRISAPEDGILSRILSFLIPLDSVRTTVLSKRWNNFWTRCITNLNFDMYDHGRSSWRDPRIFIRFIDQVLAKRDSSLEIPRFRVDWTPDDCDLPVMAHWIEAAVKANVAELDVSFFGFCEDRHEYVYPLDMPPSVFTCKSLVALKIKSSDMTFSRLRTTSCCFPNLRFLHNSSSYDSDRASRENIFRSCPVLEELTIEGCFKKHALNYNISAPELKTLTIVRKR